MGLIICGLDGKVMELYKSGIIVRRRNYAGYFKADEYKCPNNHMLITGFGSETFGTFETVDAITD
jgi:hypothetical protein